MAFANLINCDTFKDTIFYKEDSDLQDKYKVFSMMDGIVMSGEEKIGKPDVRLYQILLDRYELKAEECVFIDDRQSNITAGERIGIQGILFQSCKQAQEDFTKLQTKTTI